jgi:hypothetical protein
LGDAAYRLLLSAVHGYNALPGATPVKLVKMDGSPPPDMPVPGIPPRILRLLLEVYETEMFGELGEWSAGYEP